MADGSSTGPVRVEQSLAVLEVDARRLGSTGWVLELEAAELPLVVELQTRGPLLRAQAAVLPPGSIDPHQLLFWNTQAPLVCFAENAAGEVLVAGEIPLDQLQPDLLDRFLGLMLTSAARAREFVLSRP